VRSYKVAGPTGVPMAALSSATAATAASRAVHPSHPSGYGSEQVETEQGTPKVYESSHGVRRSFCGDCGTPLLYEDERLPGEVYVMVGAFDDPEPFEPEVHHLIPRKPE
jgi:hypothetical protein